jgi:hypothetical protein
VGDPYSDYAALAAIAVSFAGFGTIAISLGQRSGGDDAKIDAHRLTNMLTASLTLVVVALLPGLLAGLGVAPRWQLGLPAIAALCVTAGAAPRLARRNLAIRNLPGYNWWASGANLLSVVVAALAFLSCAVGLFADRAAAVFQLGLTGLLVSSVIMFSRVAMSLLLPHNKA